MSEKLETVTMRGYNDKMHEIEVQSQFVSIMPKENYYEAEIMSTSQHHLVVCILENKVCLYRVETFSRENYRHCVSYDIETAIQHFKDFLLEM